MGPMRASVGAERMRSDRLLFSLWIYPARRLLREWATGLSQFALHHPFPLFSLFLLALSPFPPFVLQLPSPPRDLPTFPFTRSPSFPFFFGTLPVLCLRPSFVSLLSFILRSPRYPFALAFILLPSFSLLIFPLSFTPFLPSPLYFFHRPTVSHLLSVSTCKHVVFSSGFFKNVISSGL